MKKKIGLSIAMLAMLFCGCNSNDDCTKTIRIPQYQYYNGQTSVTYTTQEVSCDFEDPEDAEPIEPIELPNFTYEVLQFEYTPDTGNYTSRLQMQIKLNNPNNYSVTGYPWFTVNSDGTTFSTAYQNIASEWCGGIEANSSCIFTLDVESSLIAGAATVFELVDVNYYLTE